MIDVISINFAIISVEYIGLVICPFLIKIEKKDIYLLHFL